MRTSKPVASKRVIGPAPLTPATRLRQKVGWSLPIGVTAPRPVTTARRDRSVLGTRRTPRGCRRIVPRGLTAAVRWRRILNQSVDQPKVARRSVPDGLEAGGRDHPGLGPRSRQGVLRARSSASMSMSTTTLAMAGATSSSRPQGSACSLAIGKGFDARAAAGRFGHRGGARRSSRAAASRRAASSTSKAASRSRARAMARTTASSSSRIPTATAGRSRRE